jgi:ubiquinone/menaquinone biosynthesis C-methylase UbiE
VIDDTEACMPEGNDHGPVHHPGFARVYARLSQTMEAGVAEHRTALLAGLTGRVIEVGAGNGLNFGYYPDGVTEIVAVEPEPYLRGLGLEAARQVAVPVQVIDGVAEDLPAADASFDAGVASLVLCSVRDQPRALAELYRVIRPGGQLRFFEHVRAEGPAHARVQRLADSLWPLLAGGCHTSRDTLGAITAAGFRLGGYRRMRIPDSRLPWPNAPHAVGAAHRPPAGGGT